MVARDNICRKLHSPHRTAFIHVASFPGSCVREDEREPGTHCSQVCQAPLVTCILLHYTRTSVCLLKGCTTWLYSLWDTQGSFEVKNNITLMATVCTALLKVISELQRERLRQSRCVQLEWTNTQTILTSEELSTFIAPSSSSTQSVVSGRYLLYGISQRGSLRLV